MVRGDRREIASGLFAAVVNNGLSEIENQFVDRLAGLRRYIGRIETDSLPSLRPIFAKAVSSDPYYISPAYYGLTGRRGLWKFTEDQDTGLLFCLHPNVHDTLLIFPPFANDDRKALQDFLNLIRGSQMNIQIARVDVEDKGLIEAAHKLDGFQAVMHEENVLDWKYPITTTDLNKLRRDEDGKGPKGSTYRPLRQALHSIEHDYDPDAKNSILTDRFIDFQSRKDVQTVLGLAYMWEDETRLKNKHKHKDNFTVTSFPYFEHLIKMAQNPSVNLHGMFIEVDHRQIGFVIWEGPVGLKGTANIFASQLAFNQRTIRTPPLREKTLKEQGKKEGLGPHLNTGMLYIAGRAIQRAGGCYMSLGGAETEGQYKFKIDKFPPDEGATLATISLKEMESNVVINTFSRAAAITPPTIIDSHFVSGAHQVIATNDLNLPNLHRGDGPK